MVPLIRRASPRGRAGLVVLLPNGQHRTVPVAATDFNITQEAPFNTPDQYCLPLISVRTILPLARLVKAKLNPTEEMSDEPPGYSAGTALDGARQPGFRPPADTMATIVSDPTPPIGATAGAADPASPPSARSQAGGRR